MNSSSNQVRQAEVCWSCNGTKVQSSGEEPCSYCSGSDTVEQLRTEVEKLKTTLAARDREIAKLERSLVAETARDDVEALRPMLAILDTEEARLGAARSGCSREKAEVLQSCLIDALREVLDNLDVSRSRVAPSSGGEI